MLREARGSGRFAKAHFPYEGITTTVKFDQDNIFELILMCFYRFANEVIQIWITGLRIKRNYSLLAILTRVTILFILMTAVLPFIPILAFSITILQRVEVAKVSGGNFPLYRKGVRGEKVAFRHCGMGYSKNTNKTREVMQREGNYMIPITGFGEVSGRRKRLISLQRRRQLTSLGRLSGGVGLWRERAEGSAAREKLQDFSSGRNTHVDLDFHPHPRCPHCHHRCFTQTTVQIAEEITTLLKSVMPSEGTFTTPTVTTRVVAIMPRPGQPGAPHFDKTNVTEFLEDWEMLCADYGLSDLDQVNRFPNYCSTEIKSLIKLLPEYTTPNWDSLKTKLKELYWQYDSHPESPAALNKLIAEASGMDLNVYILKYSAISEKLVNAGVLSTTDRIMKFLDGLTPKLRGKALEFCAEKDWRLSVMDFGKKDPNFQDLQKFILAKAVAAQKVTIYDTERSLRDGSAPKTATGSQSLATGTSERPTLTPKVTAQPFTVPAPASPTSMIDPITELTKQMSRLALRVEALANARPGEQSKDTTVNGKSTSYQARCIFCDSTAHYQKLLCPELTQALQDGKVRLDERNRIVDGITGKEYPLMFGKGGIKVLLERKVAEASSNAITLERDYGLMGEGSTRTITMDTDGNVTYGIADVEEKRKRDSEGQYRNVKPRADGAPMISETLSDTAMKDVEQLQPSPRFGQPSAVGGGTTQIPSQGSPILPMDYTGSTTTPAKGPQPTRYQLRSDFQEQVSMERFGNEVMDQPLGGVTMRKLMAVSNEFNDWVCDHGRRKRRPIEPTVTTNTLSSMATDDSTVSVNTVMLGPLYACPSGYARVVLNQEIEISDALLDNGSEVNLMPEWIFKQTTLPIDTEIDWKISSFDSGTSPERKNVLGVCHDVPVNVGGVEERIHIFVVKNSAQKLLLGRPWEREVRAQFTNEDDGTYTVVIKSKDGGRRVKFTAVQANHERNREFVRDGEGSQRKTLKV